MSGSKKNNSRSKIVNTQLLGKVDINFPEFCFGIIGKMPVADQPKDIIYKLQGDDTKKVTVIRSSYGFPDQKTRDLLYALMRITYRKNGFTNSRVPCSLHEMAKELGVTNTGNNLKVIKKHLDILRGAQLKFENSFFKKMDSTLSRNTMSVGVLANYFYREVSKDGKLIELSDIDDDSLAQGYFTWDEIYFKTSLQTSVNLIDFDYSLYLSLGKDTAKQLYLFLNKRRYSVPSLRMPLNEIAFTIMGISEKMSEKMFKVRQQVRQANKLLFDLGLFRQIPRFEKEFGKEYVIYIFNQHTPIPLFEEETTQISLEQGGTFNTIKNILIGFRATEGQVASLVKRYDNEKLLKVLKQLDLQYENKSTVKKIVALVNNLMANKEVDITLVQNAEDEKKEKQKAQAEYQEVKVVEDNERKLLLEKIEKQNKKADIWIKNNEQAYLEFCTQMIESKIKSNSFLNTLLNKAKAKHSLSDDLEAVRSDNVLKGKINELLKQKLFGDDYATTIQRFRN